MAGIEDVAKLAGVSTATVSRALSGKDHVSAKARAKVEAAAAELGYVASHSAYTLATGRNRNIGVVMPYVDRWFFASVLEAAETALIEAGYDLTLYNLSGGQAQRERIFNDLLLRKRVDGVFTVAVAPSATELAQLNKMKKPIVGIGGRIQGARTLVMDDTSAAELATEHLTSLGHRKIAFIGGTEGSDREFRQHDLRMKGYLEALKKSGLTAQPAWLTYADYTIQGGYHQAKQLLGNPHDAPTAIFCASDEMGFGAIMAAKDLGLRVPEDVSVVGIDNHDMSEFFGLSTVDQQVRKQGEAAVARLLQLLEDPNLEDHVNVTEENTWPIQLLVRSSTARPPAGAR
jgi:LacI family repressor for deo operon, udp, cdd, tsx, nupC, and nupG